MKIAIAVFGLWALAPLNAQQPIKATRDIKVISSAGARAMADACSAWAEQNKQVVAMAILDWAGI